MRRCADLTQRAMHGATLNEDERAFIWNTINEVKQTPESTIRQSMAEMFQRQKRRVLEAIQAQERSTRQITVDGIFNVGEATRELLQDIQPGLFEALREGFASGAIRIEHDGTFSADDPAVTSSVNALNANLRRVPQHTRALINDIILKGNQEGASVAEISRRLGDEFDRMSNTRARRIAATTTTTAFEAGQEKAFRDAGIAGSQWLTMRDSQVRGRANNDGHWEADGQKRRLGKGFRVRGGVQYPYEQLYHPGDPSGEPSNIIYCRCTRLPLLTMDESDE